MSFMIVALASCVIATIFGLLLLFAGNFVLGQWGVEGNPVAFMMGRRIGAIYLGIALMLFLGRSAPPSELRSAMCVGLGLGLALLALLGLYELVSGRAKPGILGAVVIEVVLTAGFVWAYVA